MGGGKRDSSGPEETTADFGPPDVSDRPREDYFVVLTGRQLGQLFAIDREEMTIGRASACDILIEDEGVSRRQARLVRRGDKLYLEDVGSRNGTYLNGARIEGVEALADGDKIQFGTSTTLKYAMVDGFEADYQRRMFEAAVKDGLTRTYNRRYFHEHLAAEMAFARRHGSALALLLVDIDHFKRINDQHGHLVGDRTLEGLAERLAAMIRSEDILARFGGEEFAILTRQPLRGAAGFAERLRLEVADHALLAEGVEVHITISIGVADVQQSGVETPDELVEAADQALYRAKNDGRNRVVAAAVPV